MLKPASLYRCLLRPWPTRLLNQLLAFKDSLRWKMNPSPWYASEPLRVETMICEPDERPYSGLKLLVMTRNSCVLSTLMVTNWSPLLPVSTLPTPSIVRLLVLGRLPLIEI